MISSDANTDEAVFHEFTILLKERFKKDVPTTEDSIRYTFFHCLMKSGQYVPSDVIVEFPLKDSLGQNADGSIRKIHEKIDTYIPPSDGKYGLAFEFKYDRKIPSGKNSPKTQNAGSVLKDIFRLATFKPEENLHRYFIYITKKGMATYFNNPKNNLDVFFNLSQGSVYSLSSEAYNAMPLTRRKIADTFVPCSIIGVFKSDDAPNFWLRIYEIKPLSG